MFRQDRQDTLLEFTPLLAAAAAQHMRLILICSSMLGKQPLPSSPSLVCKPDCS